MVRLESHQLQPQFLDMLNKTKIGMETKKYKIFCSDPERTIIETHSLNTHVLLLKKSLGLIEKIVKYDKVIYDKQSNKNKQTD